MYDGIADLATENLVGAALRQFRPYFNSFGLFVIGQLLFDVRQDRFRIGPLPRANDGMNTIAPLLVGQPDHRSFDDPLIAQQDVFDLARVDVVPSRDQHVVLPVENVEVAVLVHAADIAGVEPAIAEGPFRGLRPVPVARHELGAAADDLAHLAGAKEIVVLDDHAGLDCREGTATGADPVVVLRPQAGDHHRALGLPVGLREELPESGFGTPQQTIGDRRGAIDDPAQV